MRKSFIVTVLLFALMAISFAFTTAYKPLYSNLKILPKDITKPQMDSVMRSYTKALGVKCDYCHSRKEQGQGLDFASDKEDTKLQARQMMRMQARINRKYFDVKNPNALDAKLAVTCYSCHHGQGIPAKVPVAAASQPSQAH